MGFFAELSAWLNRILTTYIADVTAQVALAIEPAVITLAVLYTIVWGYMHFAGKIEEPFVEGAKRIFVMAIIIGAGIRLWMYNDVIVETFYRAPSQLAAAVAGSLDWVTIVDGIMFSGDDAATRLFQRGGIFGGNFAYYIAGFAVQVMVGFTAVYTIFLLTLSRIALSVLLALGPVFIALLLFETTKKFFESWLAQLANYALIAILTVLVAALMSALLMTATNDAVSAGGAIQIGHAVRVCLAAALTLLVMRQVMPIAAGLASGLALSTFGVASAAVAWGLGTSRRSMGHFARGLFDRETTRWDSFSRKAGYYGGRVLRGGFRAVGRGSRENSVLRVRRR